MFYNLNAGGNRWNGGYGGEGCEVGALRFCFLKPKKAAVDALFI